jgi:surface polysaccharide O-acyltransferase-like enzyme
MYIGLYLIIPFINIILNTIDQKIYNILILVLALLVAIPAAFNPIIELYPFSSLIHFPNWWQPVYPILYYIIGAYIRKYNPKVNRKLCIAIAFFLAIMQTLILIWTQQPKVNNWFLTNYATLFMVIQSAAIFLALYNFDFKSSVIRTAFKIVSSLTLEIYLFSALTDSVLYDNTRSIHLINLKLPQEVIFKHYYFIIVSIDIICNILFAVIFRFLYNKVVILFNFIAHKVHLT